MDKREGVYPEAGVADVILDASLAGILAHEAVGHTAESDLVRSGSIASLCRGQLVANEKVSLVDFAHSAWGRRVPLPIHVDDEGTPASDVVLIKEGLLVDYMTNLQDASYIGALPKGNGRAFCYSDEPLVRMRNTCILPGQDRFEDMVASIDRGYYLLMSTNGQADSTSEFMFGVSMGYVIEKGKLGKALRDTTISGVAFDVLKTVSMVGDEVVWSASGNCGKKTRLGVAMGGPAIKCRLRIGGR
jgi:TldD protein